MAALSQTPAKYVIQNPVNVAVVALSYPHPPMLFGLIRLARFIRFLRLLRLVGVAARAIEALRVILWRRGLVCVAGISLVVSFAAGAALVLIEPQTVKGGVNNGVWWAIVTASTVGYGDIAPATLPGRLVAIVMILSGASVISTLAASITAYFLDTDTNAGLCELNERMARLEKLTSSQLAEPDSPAGSASKSRAASGG